jgi:hypothetical protein
MISWQYVVQIQTENLGLNGFFSRVTLNIGWGCFVSLSLLLPMMSIPGISVCWKSAFTHRSKLSFHLSLSSSLHLLDDDGMVKILSHCTSHQPDITSIACASDSLISRDRNRFIFVSLIQRNQGNYQSSPLFNATLQLNWKLIYPPYRTFYLSLGQTILACEKQFIEISLFNIKNHLDKLCSLQET